jgi:hypothetical protein
VIVDRRGPSHVDLADPTHRPVPKPKHRDWHNKLSEITVPTPDDGTCVRALLALARRGALDLVDVLGLDGELRSRSGRIRGT